MVKPKTFNPSELIQPHSFVTVVGDELSDDGLKEGDYLYVANMQALPVDEEDLYLQRLHVFGHKYLGKGVVDTQKAYIIDPRNLEKCSKAKSRKLMNAFTEYYSATKH